jgi:hypothetical protein
MGKDMKIALCFSGQLRNGRAIAPRWLNIINEIRKEHHIDIFLHIWAPPVDQIKVEKLCPGYENLFVSAEDIHFVTETYKPERWGFDVPKVFKNSDVILTEENIRKCFDYGLKYPKFKENYINNSHSFWYSVFQSNHLKRLYELEMDFRYDLVIKSRYDTGPTKNISTIFNSLDNEIFYQELGQSDKMISDWFFCGASRTMDIACNLFNNWDQCYEWSIQHDGYWCNELLLKHQLLSHNIEPKPIDIGVQF